MSDQIVKESQELVEQSEKQLAELKKNLEDQRSQITEIGAELEKLGLNLDADLPLDNLTAEQNAQLDALQADIARIETEMTAAERKAGKPRMNKVMI